MSEQTNRKKALEKFNLLKDQPNISDEDISRFLYLVYQLNEEEVIILLKKLSSPQRKMLLNRVDYEVAKKLMLKNIISKEVFNHIRFRIFADLFESDPAVVQIISIMISVTIVMFFGLIVDLIINNTGASLIFVSIVVGFTIYPKMHKLLIKFATNYVKNQKRIKELPSWTKNI